MAQSVGAVALDIVMGKNTVTGVVNQAVRDVQNTFSDASAGIGTKVSAVGGAVQSMGAAIMPASAVVTALGGSMVKTAADFESSMSEVQAISGATGSDFDALKDKAQEMGAKTKFSASQSAEAMTYMAMAGWKTEDMLDGIEGIMNLAAASGEDLATTSDIVTDALTAFGKSAGDSGQLADIMAAASSNANTNVGLMGETFKYAAPVAGALGYTMEDTALAIGLMANAGIKGSQAGTSLRSMFSRLASPPKECAETMERLGISITNADGTMKPFRDVIGDLRDKFAGLSEAEQAEAAKALAGQEAMSGLLAIVNAAPADVEKLTSAIDNSKGSAEKMANVMNDNLKGQITPLKSQIEGLAIQMGEILVPIISDVVGAISQLAEWFGGLDENTQKTIVTIGLIVAVAGPVLAIVGKLVSGVGGLITVFGKVTTLFGGFSGAASKAAPAAKRASSGVGALSKNALGLVAAGAGILLAAAGLALLAYAAIQLAKAGTPAIACMGGLVVALALLAAGAVLAAPALTAGAVGLIAFGAAVALVGVGILAATAGVALLSTQLPTIAEYGSSAASAIAEMGLGLLALGAGAAVAGSGLMLAALGFTLAGASILIASVGIAAAAVAVALLGAGVFVLAAGSVALGVGLIICGAGLSVVAESGLLASESIALLGVGTALSIIAVLAATASCFAFNLSLIALVLPLALVAAGLLVASAACAALAVSMTIIAVASSVVNNNVSQAFTNIKTVITTIMTSVRATISGIMNGIKANIMNIFGNVLSGIRNFMGRIFTSIRSGFNKAVNFIKNLAKSAYTWGSDMINGIAKGIKDTIGKVTDAVKGVADKIRANLHFSRPDEGSLRDYETWMPDFVQGMANGIESNKYRLIDAVRGMANDMTISPVPAPALQNVGGGTYSMNGENTGGDKMLAMLTQLVGSMQNMNITVPVYLGNDLIDEQMLKAYDRRTVRSGGRV